MTMDDVGENWSRFLLSLDEGRIEKARQSLLEMLSSMDGKRFLDIGSGSGLFSLAARRLGATVHSFDFDHVGCLYSRTSPTPFPDDPGWRVEQG